MSSIQTVSSERVVSLLQELKSIMLGASIDDSWMDIQKASKYCDVSPATLRRNLDKGLKASTTTGKMLFKKSELEKWLTKGEK
jgi:hypothetical protein